MPLRSWRCCPPWQGTVAANCCVTRVFAALAALGEPAPTPWWRTLKAGGELNPKYPGGIEALTVLLAKEGHQVVARGKRWFVVDYQDHLVRFRD